MKLTVEASVQTQIATIATMAAILEAGDRGRGAGEYDPQFGVPQYYVSRAMQLFDASIVEVIKLGAEVTP